MPIDYAKQLNQEQLNAVEAADGPVLVIAAAGTGKTRTLTYRVASLVEKGVPSDRILLLTFTNRAAQEMLSRAQELVGKAVGGLWGGTFHHMANRMLRLHATSLGYGQDYTILDQDDSRRLVKSCVDALGVGGKQFPKADVILSLNGLASGREQSVEGLILDRFENHPVEVQDVERVIRLYGERKRELNSMDFDDLLANGLRLFQEHPNLLEKYQERFLYTLVDEYQDTNRVQASWVDLIAARHRNLFVVGDDFQSIYSWRGADFRNILSFPDRYPDAQVYKLETNYRSVPEVLAVANACIAGNPEQFQKELRAVREPYQRPVLRALRDGSDQAQFIINQVGRLKREGYRLEDMVVLYRAHYQAMELQLELTRARLPYSITSGVRFFEQAHVKDVMCLARLLHNPSDELAFVRLMSLLPRVGNKTALKIWHGLDGRMGSQTPEQRMRIRSLLPKATQAIWTGIEPILEAFHQENLREDPGEIMHRFVKAFYDDYAVNTYDNAPRRLEDIEELILFSSKFKDVDDFLNEIALLTNLDADTATIEEQPATLKLSTVHQAKGLEWKVVFVLWMSDGMFPSARSMDEAGGEQEERRLFYVAATRAKDELYFCSPTMRRNRDGSVAFYNPSRFVVELPDDLLFMAGNRYG